MSRVISGIRKIFLVENYSFCSYYNCINDEGYLIYVYVDFSQIWVINDIISLAFLLQLLQVYINLSMYKT